MTNKCLILIVVLTIYPMALGLIVYVPVAKKDGGRLLFLKDGIPHIHCIIVKGTAGCCFKVSILRRMRTH